MVPVGGGDLLVDCDENLDGWAASVVSGDAAGEVAGAVFGG